MRALAITLVAAAALAACGGSPKVDVFRRTRRPRWPAWRPSRRRTSARTSRRSRFPPSCCTGEGDGVVPFAGSGARTHKAIPHSELHVIAGAPHGCNVSHAAEFNSELIEFLAK